MRAVLWLLGILLLGPSCRAYTNPIRAVGPVNSRMINFVQKQVAELNASGTRADVFLIGHSPGGDVDSLLKLVQIIDKNADSVFVSGDCLSACAEFLYLVDRPIVAAPNAAIGFHGNALTASILAERFRIGLDPNCTNWQSMYSSTLKKKGVNPRTAADAVIQRLEFYKAKTEPSQIERNCETGRFYSKRRFWFPKGEQLRTLFSMRIVGKVCADSSSCIIRLAAERWAPRPDIIAGDQVISFVPPPR